MTLYLVHFSPKYPKIGKNKKLRKKLMPGTLLQIETSSKSNEVCNTPLDSFKQNPIRIMIAPLK